jgi:hypothetical protein
MGLLKGLLKGLTLGSKSIVETGFCGIGVKGITLFPSISETNRLSILNGVPFPCKESHHSSPCSIDSQGCLAVFLSAIIDLSGITGVLAKVIPELGFNKLAFETTIVFPLY